MRDPRARPRPVDFDEVFARLKTKKALAEHYNAGGKAIDRWLRGDGDGEAYVLNPPPADFATRAPTSSLQRLMDHYGRAHNTIKRWARMTGVTIPRAKMPAPANKKPVPADFAEVAPKKIKADLMAHYGIRDETLRRWLAEAGVEAMKYRPPVRVLSTKRVVRSTAPSNALPKQWLERLYTIHDRAADTLRRERWVVYRCDEKGHANGKGKFWRVGNLVCTPDELLARASKYEAKAA